MTPSPTLRLNVLDQSPIRPGSTPRQALLETVELARQADRLGYTRFWVSEHHNTHTLAGSTPEVLIAYLGSQTQHLRLGSGGVMLPHYSALKSGRKTSACSKACFPAASTWAWAARPAPTASRPTP